MWGCKMINIVNVGIKYDDQRQITALEIKLKSFTKDENERHFLIATVSAAFFKTTLLQDVGKKMNVALGNRNDIVNLTIRFKDNTLTLHDIANFVDAFQKAVDETKLF